MDINANVTAKNLNSVIEFDQVFQVCTNGSVITGTDELHNYVAPEVLDEHIYSPIWEFWSTGRSNQYGYSGPEMHSSEQLAGGMARDLLAEPGIYVLVVCNSSCDCEFSGCDCEPQVSGWAVLKLTI